MKIVIMHKKQLCNDAILISSDKDKVANFQCNNHAIHNSWEYLPLLFQ